VLRLCWERKRLMRLRFIKGILSLMSLHFLLLLVQVMSKFPGNCLICWKLWIGKGIYTLWWVIKGINIWRSFWVFSYYVLINRNRKKKKKKIGSLEIENRKKRRRRKKKRKEEEERKEVEVANKGFQNKIMMFLCLNMLVKFDFRVWMI